MKEDLLSALAKGIIVGDGAMGTYLYQMGFPIGTSYEEFNLLKPEVIAEVHRRYYEAGARLIETNTFSANSEKLSKFGLEREVAAINRAGVELARQAVGADAYVVGSIGSIRGGRRIFVEAPQVEKAFREQAAALLAAGVDGILLETFYELEELLTALRVVREQGNVPVICQFATEPSGMTQDGVPMNKAFRRAVDGGANVVGFNCQSGPNGILNALEKIIPLPGIPFSVFPNAGLPKYADGRYTYRATPEYFAETARQFADLGARIIGGCCGTTPEHIAAMAAVLQGYAPAERQEIPGKPDDAAAQAQKADKQQAVVVGERTALPDKTAAPQTIPDHAGADNAEPPAATLVDLVKQRHTVIVEWDTPRDLATDRFMRGAAALKAAGADAITMADNALAQTRMSNWSLGYLAKEQLGIRPLLHIACRDRNLIGTQSHLMGLHALGMDHVLIITGDPARVGDLPGASSVYDLTSLSLIKMVKQMNEGVAFSGQPLKQKTRFLVGAAFDPNVKYLEKAILRMERKVAAGADFFMTQPVYNPALIEQLYHASRHIRVPIFLGLMPVISGRNTEFLHNEVPGIRITEDIRKRMAGLEGEEGRRTGIAIGKELLDTALQYFNGIYLMTPITFYTMTAELTRYVWEKTGRTDIPLSPSQK